MFHYMHKYWLNLIHKQEQKKAARERKDDEKNETYTNTTIAKMVKLHPLESYYQTWLTDVLLSALAIDILALLIHFYTFDIFDNL